MRPPCSSAQSETLARRRQFSRHLALDSGARGASASGWGAAFLGIAGPGVVSAVLEAVGVAGARYDAGTVGVACGEGVGAAGAIGAIGDVADACGEDAGGSTRVGAGGGGEQAAAVTVSSHQSTPRVIRTRSAFALAKRRQVEHGHLISSSRRAAAGPRARWPWRS
jgi:hypothetical protein